MERVPSHLFELYVEGESVRSRAARQGIERLCSRRLGDECELRVIDAEADPEAASQAGVGETPTLIRRRPLPEVRLVGDVSDEQAISAALGLDGP